MLTGLGVFLVSLVIFFSSLNSFPLRNWDEAWYAEITKNMASGNYNLLVPFWNGEYYFDKPPLYFWLSLPFFKAFGEGEWQSRLVSASAAATAAFLTYTLGKRLFGKAVGIFTFIVFVSTGQVVSRFSQGNLDALLVCFTLLTFYFYILSDKKRGAAFLSGLFLGLAFLTKGLGPAVITLVLLAFYTFVKEKTLSYKFFMAFLVSIFVYGLWFLAAAAKYSPSFVNSYLYQSTVAGLTSSFSTHYFNILIRDFGFWLIAIFIFLVKGRRFLLAQKEVLATFSAVVVIFVFFLGFLKEKLGWYILPAYPFLSIVAACGLAIPLGKFPKITLLLVSLMLLGQLANIRKIESTHPDKSEIGASLGLYAQRVIPREELIILDSNDFASFLFYSNHKKIIVASAKGGRPGEWWILKYEELPTFLNNNPAFWVITPNLENLPIKTEELQKEADYLGYGFFRQ